MVRGFGFAAVAIAVAAAGFLPSVAASASSRPLLTAFTDVLLPQSDYEIALRRMRSAGASLVRTDASWATVAPEPPETGTAPADPANPAYQWRRLDDRLTSIAAAGLEPLLVVNNSARWARQARDDRDALPDPAKLAAFAEAAAGRYSGATPGLPIVRYWQLWNEPNASVHFHPQMERGRPISPLLYRQLLQSFTPAIRRGNPAARVVVGGLSPYGKRIAGLTVVAPMRFLREFVCVTPGAPRRACRTRVPFDIWSHHPYTANGARGHAFRADDVALGDLAEMRRLLLAAQRLGQLDSRGPVDFWVTEFSWDSNPPDPKAVPAGLHARWTAEALHQMWSSGVTLVTWFLLRDEAPPPASIYQSGLWYRGATLARDRPKPALQAFRFPLVAYPQRGRVFVWGRTPAGRRGTVVVERSFRGGWARLGTRRTNVHGIFTARFPVSVTTGFVRARLLGSSARARPFSLRDPGPRRYGAFGS